MTNLLDDEETYDQQEEDLPLDDHYKVDYLRDEKYDWVYNSLDEWEGAQESKWEDQTVALNNSNWLTSVVTTDLDL